MLMKLTPGVNFIKILLVSFSCKSVFGSFSLFTFWHRHFLAKEYRYKSCSYNVDEINSGSRRRNQHFNHAKELIKPTHVFILYHNNNNNSNNNINKVGGWMRKIVVDVAVAVVVLDIVVVIIVVVKSGK